MFAVQLGQARAGGQLDNDLLPVKRARKWGNDGRSSGSVLRMAGITDAGQAAGMFYQNMLESASRSHERDAAFASGPNRAQHRFGIAIRTAWADHHRCA
jgi:hypothetical protein